MKLIPNGDYYIWYCDWCDSRNNTLWTRLESGQVFCGACHTQLIVPGSPADELCSAI
jgi:hypothetical protein